MGEKSIMKKIIYTSMLLMLSSSVSKITLAEMPEPSESGQHVTEPQENIQEKEAEQKKLEAQKEGEINNLNRLFGQLKGKGLKETAKINAEIQKITGSDIKLDPTSKNFQTEKQQLQQATIDKYNERIKKISEQIKAAKETTDTVAKDFEDAFSENGLSDNEEPSSNEEPSLSQTEINHMINTYEGMLGDFRQALTDPDILENQLNNNQSFLNEVNHLSNPSPKEAADLKTFLKNSPDSESLINNAKKEADTINALNQVKTSLENIAKNPGDQNALIARNDAVRNLEKLTGITIAGNNGIVDNLSDLNQNNLQDIYQKVADTYSSSDEQESAAKTDDSKPEDTKLSPAEMDANNKALNQATSMVTELKSFHDLTTEETKNLNEKVNNAKEALSEGIGSKIVKAMNDFIEFLKSLLDKLISNAVGSDYADAKKIIEMQNRLKNLSDKLESISARQKESAKKTDAVNSNNLVSNN